MELVKTSLLVVLTLLYIDTLIQLRDKPDCPPMMELEPLKCQELGLNYYLTEPIAGNIVVNCVLD